ncbi:MAG: Tic22 family protein [Cyanobacteria bacterium P01_G01_bin.54]
MTSLKRWLTSIGIGGLLMALGSSLPAIALEPEEINRRLQEIPVFTVTDSSGAPLVARVEEQLYAGVFITPQAAIAFRESVVRENPAFADQVRVTPVSLEEIYALDQQQAALRAAANQAPGTAEEPVDFVYVPSPNQVEFAESLIPENLEIDGVPLFAVKVNDAGVAANDNSVSYITLPRMMRNAEGALVETGEVFVPFFFSREQAQELARQFDASQERQGNASKTAVLEVHTLEILLDNWERLNEPGLSQIWLVPDPDSLDYVNQGAPAS